jgi:hypothetical protein
MNRGARLAFAAVLLAVPLLNTASAYLDPGTGSFVLQLLIGGLMGALFALGLFWRRVRAFLGRIFSAHKKD